MDTYEKKYKEALGWMQSLYSSLHGTILEDAEHYFPELKESEDEERRKELITFLEELSKLGKNTNFNRWSKSDCANWICWLEKQGKRGTDGNNEEIPNSAWSEEDEKILEDIKFNFMYNKENMTGAFISRYNRFFDKIKSLKPQPKQEWSEEDEEMLKLIKFAVSNLPSQREDTRQECLAWLESLKDRLQ